MALEYCCSLNNYLIFFKTAVNSLSVFKVDMANLSMYSIFTHHLCTCLHQPCFLCLRTILMSKKQKKDNKMKNTHSLLINLIFNDEIMIKAASDFKNREL